LSPGEPHTLRILLLEVNPYVPPSMPISLGYLAASLKREGHEVRIVNMSESGRLSPLSFAEILEEMRPQLVGFAVYQRNMLVVRGLCRAVKETLPDAKIILGGPQATFMPSEALRVLREVDFLCRGEGEVVVLEVVRALESGRIRGPVPGTTTRVEDDHWEEGEEVRGPEDLDAYPSPFLEGVLELRGLEEAIMLTSRGCPYGCLFCYTPRAFGRKVRYHSVDRVLEEISWLRSRGLERFWLADPSFSFNRSRTVELMERIAARGLRAKFWLETRADLVDEEILDLMARAGVEMVAYGLESASDRVLERIGKGISPGEVKRAVLKTMERGMGVELFSQYGLPGETLRDALNTLEFVRSLVPVRGNTNAQQMRLYFGCPISDDPGSFGIRPLDEKRPPYISVGPRYETEWMTVEDIHKVRDAWKAASLDGGKRLVS